MTLVIMAAGIGSRFGTGIKQLQKVDQSGHIIMDYSIHDAIAAGFQRIVFILRREIEAEFKDVIGHRIEAKCAALGVTVSYAYQAMPDPMTGRTKPYGTGHAVLACKETVKEPFAVINADDYYGKQAFLAVGRFLQALPARSEGCYCLAGFLLKNTLSEHGGVTRGICQVDQEGALIKIRETKNLCRTPNGIAAEGIDFAEDTPVSMNMWGFTPDFMERLDQGFSAFLQEYAADAKAEFLIPAYVGELLAKQAIRVQVLESPDSWFGMTYREDIPEVVEKIAALIGSGTYSKDLYSDL